jgi:hypothetical protein
MGVTVSGNLPAGDGNGLVAILLDLIENPKKLHVAICIIDAKKITTDADTGEVIPTARIRRIEVVTSDEDRTVCERLMRRALDTRTGREALPYDLETEIQAAFDNVKESDDDDDNG